ncbi:formimidoylglutamate deiminase [Euzebya rosea]|uniref:formimidoylglutamate deiminase n=1 Tax=Euzebya rosea TaxID=2052804 RepID=UPI00196ACC72|nr:formimidoylglutamate deiminase [Euzebya rosea]
MTVDWYACDQALVGAPSHGVVADRVVLGVADGRLATVEVDSARFDEVAAAGTHLRGLTLPGLVNAHSHAFHRALRGRTHGVAGAGEPGSFWTWREVMYGVAGRLDPDRYHALARGVFGEMALAGITAVGEFHYLHHDVDGRPYADANVMGEAMLAAAAEAGIRITLLDTLYLTAGVGDTVAAPGLSSVQQRFSDGSVESWLSRLADLAGRVGGAEGAVGAGARVGAALHSVRAVPASVLGDAVAGVAEVLGDVSVLHAHVSEQPAEVSACVEALGVSPVVLLDRAGALAQRFTAVHGVWLDEGDIGLLGSTGSTVCACPTTERDLADGVVPAVALRDAGADLALGSDQHVVIDLLEEARAVEADLRLVAQQRGLLSPASLVAAATAGGARSLGWADAGRIEEGALADLCVVGLDSVRLAGVSDLLAGVVHAGTAADVTHTIVGGRVVVAGGQHLGMDVAEALRSSISSLASERRP